MNRLLFLSCFFLPVLCSSQNYGLCMQVLASTGGSGTQGNYQVSWTVGEVVINTVGASGFKVTQGFHQPDVCAPVSTWNIDLELLGIEIFPNPSSGVFNIRYSPSEKSALQVSAFDVLGHQVLQPQALLAPEGSLLDASQWPPGLYFLQIQDANSKGTATVRVLRQ
jgi:Secretion system C-terminal sorting domain